VLNDVLPPAVGDSVDIREVEAPTEIALVPSGSAQGSSGEKSDPGEPNIDDLTSSMLIRIKRGKKQIVKYVTEAKWRISPDDQNGNAMLQSHRASKVNDKTVHGALVVGLKESPPGMFGVARIIKAPEDFESKFPAVMAFANGLIGRRMDALRSIPPGSLESLVQDALAQLVDAIALGLGLEVEVTTKRRVAVGGILAENKYDVRGETDICVHRCNRCLMVIEVKTKDIFGSGDAWYRKCRAAQILAPLYHFNAPTFLATTEYWKLFYENKQRDSIFTYPTARLLGVPQPSDFTNILAIEGMGRQFVKMVIICLTASDAEECEQNLTRSPERALNSAYSVGAVPDSAKKADKPESAPKKPRRDDPKPNPTYYSTKEDGQTERIQVRLFGEEALALMDWKQIDDNVVSDASIGA
jgi:hypothetical protein